MTRFGPNSHAEVPLQSNEHQYVMKVDVKHLVVALLRIMTVGGLSLLLSKDKCHTILLQSLRSIARARLVVGASAL